VRISVCCPLTQPPNIKTGLRSSRTRRGATSSGRRSASRSSHPPLRRPPRRQSPRRQSPRRRAPRRPPRRRPPPCPKRDQPGSSREASILRGTSIGKGRLCGAFFCSELLLEGLDSAAFGNWLILRPGVDSALWGRFCTLGSILRSGVDSAASMGRFYWELLLEGGDSSDSAGSFCWKGSNMRPVGSIL
jgi:hypothetical protein